MDIKIYTIPTRPWSQKAKEWLKKKKIAFQELDTVESETYRDEILQKTSQVGVPVIEIDGKCIIGFQEMELEEAIGKAK